MNLTKRQILTLHTNLEVSNNFSLNYEKFKAGPHVRHGLAFPVVKRDTYILTTNLFVQMSNYYMNGSKPLLTYVGSETPILLREKLHIGISLGITF